MTVSAPAIPQSIARAWQLLQQGNHAAADEVVRPLLLAGAMGDELVPLIAAIRLQQGRFAEAAPLFERARALYPGEARFAFLHGTALGGMNRFEQAVSAFQATIRLQPNIADPYLAMGQAQRKLGQFEEAVSAARRSVRLNPYFSSPHRALAPRAARRGA